LQALRLPGRQTARGGHRDEGQTFVNGLGVLVTAFSSKWSWYFPETGGKVVWAEVHAE
jgi:hypothetical protein